MLLLPILSSTSLPEHLVIIPPRFRFYAQDYLCCCVTILFKHSASNQKTSSLL